MKQNNKTTLTLLAVCIIIWTVNVIVDLVVTVRPHRFMKLALDSVFLAAWIAAYVAKLTGFHEKEE